MSDDHLVRRLRATTQHLASSTYVDLSMWQSHSSACFEAADAIERLAADNAILSKWHIDAEDRAEAAERKVEKLRRALKPLLDVFERCETGFTPHLEIRFAVRDSARAALAETENGDE